MTRDSDDILAPEAALALAWSPAKVRAPLRTFFQLDRRLARIVARTSEPILGQMRLAWWRDMLAAAPGERPSGDAVLDAVGADWRGGEAALSALVDAWEVLVVADRLGPDEVAAFAAGRAAPFVALAGDAVARPVSAAARCWALTDAAPAISDPSERALFIDAARAAGAESAHLGRDMRGLAVLAALSRRALRQGGRPLMEGRGASLVAMKAAILGR
ncbi:MAG: hypothetical protein GC147_00660 [Porphyrobacter sp.]|nr:hypothetical protein [Porphyrobacter sp.]